jgi:putative PIN family toxin of toxin-antitoxin system
MRVVLDTNLVVRAARRRASLARSILLETLSEPHSLILSNSLYFEIFKVMYYDEVRRRHGLNDARIAEFMDALVEGSMLVVTRPLGTGPLVGADPEDDHVLLTAIAGKAEVLGTNNRHFFSPDVEQFALAHGIHIARDVDLLAIMRQP